MSTTVEIPGGTAVLRDASELRVRHRRLIETAALGAMDILAKLPQGEEAENASLSDLHLSRSEASALMEMQDATIVAFLESWTLAEPLPTLDTVGDMDTAVYDALAAATRLEGAAVAKGSDFGPNPDPESPTGGSSSSAGPSEDETSTSLPGSLDSTESSDTAA